MESSDDSYDMIPKRPKEFLKLIQQPDAARVLQDVGVDVVSWFLQSILGRRNPRSPPDRRPVHVVPGTRQVGLFDFVSVIFPTLDAKLTFQDLMQVPSPASDLGPRVSLPRRVQPSPWRVLYVFAYVFFVLIFGMGQIGRSEKIPLNVMKRCVFPKNGNQNVLPLYSTAIILHKCSLPKDVVPDLWFCPACPTPVLDHVAFSHPVGCLNVYL